MKTPSFKVGDKVKWTAKFLRNIGDYSAASANRTGTITGEPKSYSPKFTVIPIQWDDESEVGAVNVANIIHVNRIHLEAQ